MQPAAIPPAAVRRSTNQLVTVDVGFPREKLEARKPKQSFYLVALLHTYHVEAGYPGH